MNLHEFTEWFRNDLAYKAPEQWPSQVWWFLSQIEGRYGNVAELDEEAP